MYWKHSHIKNNVNSYFISNSPKQKTAQLPSVGEWLQTVAHAYPEIHSSLKRSEQLE